MPRWFRRRRRFTLGRYVAPAPVEPAPVSELVDEGVLIAGAAVRLAVTNLMIVRSVRDGLDYDEERYVAAVREEVENLAHEKTADADRVARLRAVSAQRGGRAEHHSDYRAVDGDLLERREEVSRALAERLNAISRDDAWVRTVVASARESALSLLGGSIPTPVASAADDPHYARERPERMRQVVDDLLMLQVTPPEER
jgi:hypothetical protein